MYVCPSVARGQHSLTFSDFQNQQCENRIMLAVVTRRRVVSRALFLVGRAKSTSVDPKVGGPLGDDGRHELWREGIYDHDNEPK